MNDHRVKLVLLFPSLLELTHKGGQVKLLSESNRSVDLFSKCIEPLQLNTQNMRSDTYSQLFLGLLLLALGALPVA